ncbi:MAG: hypothetical protein RL708_1920 [Bacteroidota bacterium]|jgi:PKD repeat protein
MKKVNFTLLILMVSVLASFAQMPYKQNSAKAQNTAAFKPTKAQLMAISQQKNQKPHSKASGSNYAISYGDALSADAAYSGITDFTNTSNTFRYLHLWPDSLPVLPTSTTPFHWYIHSYSDVFSPASKFIGNYAKSALNIPNGDLFFTRNNSFSIDSVTVFYGYIRNVAAPDSMYIYLINYNSSTFSSTYNFQSDTVTKFKVIDYDYVKNAPTGTNITVLKYALTLADTLGVKTIPVSFNLPALTNNARYGQNVAMAISFKPGQSYALGDTLTANATTAIIHKKLNNFFVLTYEETAGGVMTSKDAEYSFNNGNIVTTDERYNIGGSSAGWNGTYIPSIAYTAPFVYEHAYVLWHLDFEGAAYTYTKTNAAAKFTDVSNFTPTAWSWDFGDGIGTDNVKNPSYTYAANGTYTVCLTASNSSKTYTTCRQVKITTAGINNVSEFTLGNVYPNPVVAGTMMNIPVDLNGTANQAVVKVYNTVGQVVSQSNQVVNDNVTVATENLTEGMYMFSVEINGQKTTGKFSVVK